MQERALPRTEDKLVKFLFSFSPSASLFVERAVLRGARSERASGDATVAPRGGKRRRLHGVDASCERVVCYRLSAVRTFSLGAGAK